MGVGGDGHASAAFPREVTRYPKYRRLGGPHGRLDGCGKTSLLYEVDGN